MEPFQVGIYALIAVLLLLANRVPIAAALGVVASVGIFVIFAWRPGQVNWCCNPHELPLR